MFKFNFLRVLWVLNLPILLLILPQAIFVKRNTLRLPAAIGPREQILDQQKFQTGSPLQLLHWGESTVDGVGVAETHMGFTAQIATSLHLQLKRNVHYVIHGHNGLKLGQLIDQLPQANNWDLAIITMGVNDCKGLTSLKLWRKQLASCIQILRQQQAGPIFFTQVPPMGKFPALPQPLKYLLGIRSTLLNMVLQDVCDAHKNVFLLHTTLNIEPGMMAEDGFHPSALGYQNWAQQITPNIVRVVDNQII